MTTSFLDSVARNSMKTVKSYTLALKHFQSFLKTKYDSKYTLENIIKILLSPANNEVNVYELLNDFISYLLSIKNEKTGNGLSTNSITLYLAGVRSYLAYYDIDIVPSKFKRKVKLPKLYREDEEPLDNSDIRKILLACNNRRLKPFLLVLASGGMRASEGLAIRLKDINFSVSPTMIRIRKEYAKTRGSERYIHFRRSYEVS